ncbi:MAG: T9SS type A sorting domain-containing protein [Candidatus Eisenbacteria bacterium]|nr:T9SS type A sorting domain-containing protein [Candidatus Eisenbacteria bacterium]
MQEGIGPMRRAASASCAAFCLALLVFAASPLAADPLVCRKGAALRGLEEPAPKVWKDDLPRVSAVEKARRRGNVRGGRTTVRLLAIRVQFQPDSDPRSTGDGTFDLSEWDGATFDGPPHDREYFRLHMTALENYYESVSHGRLDIEFDVAPSHPDSGYVLPERMGSYHDYSEEQVWYVSQVERFTRDAFAAADTSDTIDFSQYDGYVLFHAGADWQSDINYDSPFDLPSAHISLGEPILVNDGAVEVWDAAIMPETSSQDGYTIVLNGTLAHEVGHILGLPDLYNTYNFFPAIGYWGIMDSGGRIGMDTPWGWAYGLVPAAPCAWSKEYMGWLDPVVVLDDLEGAEVKASSMRGPGERLYKIPATSDEYFLVENRLDDIGGDLTVAIDQERGVVLGPVDPDDLVPPYEINHEYDFLLPGPGLVIYHIDDTRVIPGLMPFDTVNYDRHRRGVAIEEADGIMDLGDIGSFYWTGSAYDPFFAANNDSFAWDTFPSTDTNTGGRTYLAVTGISDPDSVMTMNVGFDRWKEGWPADTGEASGPASPRVVDLDGDGTREVVVATRDGTVNAWRADGTPLLPLSDPPGRFALVPGGVRYSPAVADLDGDGEREVIAASEAGSLYVWAHQDLDGDGLADLHSPNYPVPIDGPASSSPLAADLDGETGLEVAAASQGGFLTILDAHGAHVGSSPYAFGHLVLNEVTLCASDLDLDGADEVVMSTTNRGWIAAMNEDGTPVSGWPVTVPEWEDDLVFLAAGDIDRGSDGASEIVGAGTDGTVRVWDRSGREVPGWPVDLERPAGSRPALSDLDGDGFLEIAVSAGSSGVFGLRSNGSRVENWPLVLERGDSLGAFPSPPIVGDLDGDGGLDVVATGPDGNVFAWDAVSGEELPGFPLSCDPPAGAPWAGDVDGDGELDLLVSGDSGRVLMYGLPYDVSGDFVWESETGDASGRASYPDSLLGEEPAPSGRLMDPERTYCYPNPVRDDELTIRVYMEEPGEVEIRILDVSGQLVEKFGIDGALAVNEVTWDVSGVASGLYIVHVQAFGPYSPGTIAGGKRDSETRNMKVAVIR